MDIPEKVVEGRTETAEEASETSFVHLTYYDAESGTGFEQAEWVNKIVKQMWPFISVWLRQVIKETEPQIQKIKLLGSFKFVKIDLGKASPILSGVKVHDPNPTAASDLIIDADFSYIGDADVLVSVAGIEGGVTSFVISGTLQLGFKLDPKLPFINDVYVTLLAPPRLDYQLTETLAALDFFGVDGAVNKLINEEIAKKIVLPNKIEHKVKVSQKFSLMPEINGVIRTEAKLQGFEKYNGKPATITLTFGSHSMESHDIIIGDDSAKATFVAYLVHQSQDESMMKVRVVIKKDADDDERDKIFKISVNVSDVDNTPRVQNFPLAPQGSVVLTSSLACLSDEKENLRDTALLEFHIESVTGLSRQKKPLLAKLSVGTQVMQLVSSASKPSKFERHVPFVIKSPDNQLISVELLDLESATFLGKMSYKLPDLIARDKMSHLQEAFTLHDGIKKAKVVMSLKITAVN